MARRPRPLSIQDAQNEEARSWALLVQDLSVCVRHWRRQLSACTDAWQLSDTQFLMLLACSRSSSGCSQNGLAAMIGVSTPQASGLVEQLRVRELISARKCNLDRRRQLWRLTEAGQQVLDAVLAQLAAPARQVDEFLSADDQHSLRSIVERMNTQQRARTAA